MKSIDVQRLAKTPSLPLSLRDNAFLTFLAGNHPHILAKNNEILGKIIIQNAVGDFEARIKAKTFSSICNVPKDNDKYKKRLSFSLDCC